MIPNLYPSTHHTDNGKEFEAIILNSINVHQENTPQGYRDLKLDKCHVHITTIDGNKGSFLDDDLVIAINKSIP